ncbi:MAG TPA: efflux RND transporter periplasmic adaptor subunit [Bryobacteraceae bacterium]|nr:efflux RND transporter periplasmic adaptor subunit [Bryobacteraceae bacterium]
MTGIKARALYGIAAISAAAMYGCTGSKANTPAVQPVPVEVVKVSFEDQPRTVTASGSVLALEQAVAAFETPGRVLRIHAQLGDAVRRGQLLALLDPEEYAIHERMADAQNAAAQAGAEMARNGARQEEIDAARAAMSQAEAADALARAEYGRIEFLFSRKSVTASDMDRARAERDMAAQRLAEGRAKLSALETGLRREEKDRAFAAAGAAEAQAHLARKKRGDAVLRSPLNGFIARKDIELGQVIGAGAPAYFVVSLNPVKVRAGLPESAVGLLKRGMQAEITASAAGKTFRGQVEYIGVAADPATRLFPVEITAANPAAELKPGMVAQVSIGTGARESVLAVPSDAVVRSPEGIPSVFILDAASGKVFLRRVDTGEMLDGRIRIRSGLNGGEAVVVAGQNSVSDGALVRVTAWR